ncbi:type IV pilus assembly protein PilM [Pedosphaera parvula]|uniref:Type IV pilus assembly protein PilM n=1 Tax=Pedosphaera parvula (strain Ellin514) TaxID=320771 RepID=B9XEZ8_PEDPL|nr:type IV pilus assembly protein PilM [Pedosphaera parvula]EEF61496.1 type IV pilus assembly protein PilM [Pedosphaera parvula Ellin514]
MLNSKSFLTVDFGAGSLKLAEFEINEAGGLRLKQYGLKPLGLEGSKEETREAAMLKALQEVLAEKGIKAKDVNVCAPGFHVFSKFVKLPPVDTSKVTQIIQYEAQQNVPFPLSEVVWDYQILGSSASGELEVLLVAIKSEIVEGLFRVTEKAGLRLQLADVSPAALCNAFRYNYGDLEDCTMLLDIGAKTSNLLFFEKGKVYSRSINLGANSISQDFANESKLPFPEAEAKKISEGFVSLGGAYEEPENPHQAAISKIARQFMTRLHIQVNQTMQFYRGQQGGSPPQRLFLSGGASIMPYTAQFFAEKLNVPVEYFNPFRNVQIDPAINLEELARVAHSLGEVVGLGLRNLAHCPVELNLMPESTLNWVNFNQKKPYFIATVFSLVAVVFATGFIFDRLANVYTDELDKLKQDIAPLLAKESAFNKAYKDMQKSQQDALQYATLLGDRFYWGEVLTDMHRTMAQVEGETGASLHTPTGVWIEKMISARMSAEELAATNEGAPAVNPFDPAVYGGRGARGRMGLPGQDPTVPPAAEQAPASPTPEGTPATPAPRRGPKGSSSSTNEISTITILCRAVDVTSSSSVASANTDIAYAVERALKESPLFDKDETHLSGTINPTDANGTFTFGVDVKLKRPLKL